MKTLNYKIINCWDHFNNKALFQVIGVNNEYNGEYNETKKEALKELNNLK